ncbi:unnamed protein product [Sphenostylis stenocarpa]|uniref:Uncharacterized protein n=1 Tax=Sphenostylis stenocarpa TaxID=92480 RepID=A0AA86RRY2_9FABA|nr:unnamed protein product [Sphenostylis stenocarpa]
MIHHTNATTIAIALWSRTLQNLDIAAKIAAAHKGKRTWWKQAPAETTPVEAWAAVSGCVAESDEANGMKSKEESKDVKGNGGEKRVN